MNDKLSEKRESQEDDTRFIILHLSFIIHLHLFRSSSGAAALKQAHQQ